MKSLIKNAQINEVNVFIEINGLIKNHHDCQYDGMNKAWNPVMCVPSRRHTALLSGPVGLCERVGPVPGLEVAPQSLQVYWGEVSPDALPQPPLPLCGAAAARLTEFIPEMFPSNPPEEEERVQGR